MIDRGTSLTLIAVGLGFLYFAWLFFTTGILVNRGQALTAAENPTQFSFALAVVVVLGAASVIGGLVALAWPRR